MVGGIEDHALAAPQAEDRLADRGERCAAADRDVQRAGQLGVAHRPRPVRGGQAVGDAQHDVPGGVALEGARAVGERARLGRQVPELAVRAVPHPDARDRLGDVLAVGADVLDRRRADRAGDAREALDAGATAGDAALHERVPRLAGGDVQEVAVALDAGGEHADHGPREAGVGHDEVAAARHEEHRLAGRVGGAHGLDELLVAARLDGARGGAAEAQRRQLGEGGGHGRARYLRPAGTRPPASNSRADAPPGRSAPAPAVPPHRGGPRGGARGARAGRPVAARRAAGAGRPGAHHRHRRDAGAPDPRAIADAARGMSTLHVRTDRLDAAVRPFPSSARSRSTATCPTA